MTPYERYDKLKHYLAEENPLLLNVVSQYSALDKIAHKTGLLDENDTYSARISWWPLISVLGTFSAGKSSFINSYIGHTMQASGNQAVDDKFTVICYGHTEDPVTLPGLALDADPRFPFYNISREVEKVDAGEGERVNRYLQLKTIQSEAVHGKIIIDSPGFDADSQRDAILKITDHIIDMSDLVLVFFDARHPEPGAMRDTLEHLVSKAVTHRDTTKILYILNQIDTTARDDNLEDVISAWQRAMSQQGLIAGDFYAIYNEDLAEVISDPARAERYKRKKDADLIRIVERMNKVGVERAYRIIKGIEETARNIRDNQMPQTTRILQRWRRRMWWFDSIVLGSLFIASLVGIFTSETVQKGFYTLMAAPGLDALVGLGLLAVLVLLHYKIADWLIHREIRTWQQKDPEIARALENNNQWWRSFLTFGQRGWDKRSHIILEELISESRHAIQKLNDQYVSPSGKRKEGA